MNNSRLLKNSLIIIDIILVVLLVIIIYYVLNGLLTKDFITPEKLSFYEHFRVKISIIT